MSNVYHCFSALNVCYVIYLVVCVAWGIQMFCMVGYMVSSFFSLNTVSWISRWCGVHRVNAFWLQETALKFRTVCTPSPVMSPVPGWNTPRMTLLMRLPVDLMWEFIWVIYSSTNLGLGYFDTYCDEAPYIFILCSHMFLSMTPHLFLSLYHTCAVLITMAFVFILISFMSSLLSSIFLSYFCHSHRNVSSIQI